MMHGMQPYSVPRAFSGKQSQMAEAEVPKKLRFEKDFIILSEFSEQVGPIPIQFIPYEKAKGSFDASHFSVRIMSSDYQSTNGKLIGEDTQVILSEQDPNFESSFAYVHYFCLNDLHARGYVRQYCLSYISSSLNKIIDNFEPMMERFSEVTSILKCANQRTFLTDVQHHLADLEHTMKLLHEEGWTKAEDVDIASRYCDFDFAKEDVPERDPEQVQKNIEEAKMLLEGLKTIVESESNQLTWEKIKQLRSQQKQRKRQKDKEGESPVPKKAGGFTSYLPSHYVEQQESSAYPGSVDAIHAELTSSTSSDLSTHYEPQRVMTHIVSKFERSLRPLSILTHRGYEVAMEKLKTIQKFFSRSELALEVEREERKLLDPYSSLLSIGRVPVMNALQDYREFPSQQLSPLLQPQPYQITSRNTYGQPTEIIPSMPFDYSEHKPSSDFDTSFLEDKNGLTRCPLYIDPRNRLYFQRGSDSFVLSEQYEDSEPDHPVSRQPLVGNSSRRLEFDDTNMGQQLNSDPDFSQATTSKVLRASHLVAVEDDKVSHGSHPSTAFATPNETTPEGGSPPNEDDEFKKQNGHRSEPREELSSAVAVLTDLQRQEAEVTVPEENGMLERIDSSLDEQSDESRSKSKSPINTDHQEDNQQTLLPNMNGGIGPALIRNSSLKFLAKSTSLPPQGTDVEACVEIATPVVNSETETQVPLKPPILSEDTPDTVPLNFTPPVYTAAATTTIGLNGSPKMNNHRNDFEESFSAGSGCFNRSGSLPRLSGSPYKSGSSEIQIVESGNWSVPTGGGVHKPVSPDSPLAKARGHYRSPTSMSTGTNTSSDEQLYSKPSSNGFPPALESSITQYGSATRKKRQPFNLTISSKRPLSPEQYYSPIGVGGSFPIASTGIQGGTYYMKTFNNTPLSPGQRSMASVASVGTVFSGENNGATLIQLNSRGSLPLVSSVEHIECSYMFKPGRGIFNFCKDNPAIQNIFYCLLHGRPLVIIGKPQEEKIIRRIVRALWLLVPGHSSHQQVILWQDKPLDIKDLSRIKLMGLSSTFAVEAHLKRYVSRWDCTNGKLYTPPYNGELLKPILLRTKERKKEEALLAQIHSLFSELAMKAYVYYHGYCASGSRLQRQPSTSEPSPRKFHTVSKDSSKKSRMHFLSNLGIKGSDADIVEYLVELIRDQQLSEWNKEYGYDGTPQDNNQVTLKLHARQCVETYLKPKKLY